MSLVICKPFEMNGKWFCDVEDKAGETIHTAGPYDNADEARWAAIDWVRVFEAT